MSRVLLIVACVGMFGVNSAKADTQGTDPSSSQSGFELGTRLSKRLDIKVPQSDQAKPGSVDNGAVGENEHPKKAPIRKVRVIY